MAASVTLSVSAAAVLTEAADTASGVGVITVSATASIGEAPEALAASATIATTVQAGLSVTEAADTLAALATTAISAAFGASEAPDSSAASAAVVVGAALVAVESNDTLVADLGAGITASASLSESGDTLTATVSVVGNSIDAETLLRLADIWTRLGLNPAAPTVQSAVALSAGPMALAFSESPAGVICTRSDATHASPLDPQTMVLEIWQRLGLDPDSPMLTGENEITFAGITLGLSGSDAVTVQRA